MIQIKKNKGSAEWLQRCLENSEQWKWDINMSWYSSRATNKRKRKEARLAERVVKWLKFTAMGLFVLGLISIALSLFGTAKADDEIQICQSDKCEARKARLEECSAYTNNEEEKILCATYITLHKITRDVTPKEKEAIKEEIKKLDDIINNKWGVDLDRLAKAVAIAETTNCTKGYGVTHNNCFWIKHWNTVPCPWVPKWAMCKFKTKEESFEAFKTIWGRWYKTYPTYEQAHRWTGWDRVYNWLNIVKANY